MTTSTSTRTVRPLFNNLPPGMISATAAKLVLTIAIRMPYVFLATIARGLDTSVGRLGSLLGLAELVGLGTFLIGRSVDRGAHKLWLLIGTGSTLAGLFLMAVSTGAPMFAMGFAGVTFGGSVFTVAVHSWIGNEVPYERRGRVIGIVEMSWAAGVLVGAPIAGLIIALTNWQGPWAFIALALLPLGWWLKQSFPERHPMPPLADRPPMVKVVFSKQVVLVLILTFAVSFGGTALFSTFGAWLEDDFKLSSTTVGLFAVAIGLAELVASAATIRFSDRWGKSRSTLRGLALMAVGSVAIVLGPNPVALAMATLVIAFLGFEFGIICMLSIASEVSPENRGAVMSLNGAASTLARACSAALATSLYASHGMGASAAVALASALVGVACLSAKGIRTAAR